MLRVQRNLALPPHMQRSACVSDHDATDLLRENHLRWMAAVAAKPSASRNNAFHASMGAGAAGGAAAPRISNTPSLPESATKTLPWLSTAMPDGTTNAVLRVCTVV